MALPQSLGELVELLELTLNDLPVTCYYCQKNLPFHDKILFMFSDLALYWEENVYSASCWSCLKGVARLEFLTGYEDLKSTREIELIFGKPFGELNIRCYGCYRFLNVIEKLDVVSANESVAIVRSRPRALCSLCKIGVP